MRSLAACATIRLPDVQCLGLPATVPITGVEDTVGLLAEMTLPVDFIELGAGRSSVAPVPILR